MIFHRQSPDVKVQTENNQAITQESDMDRPPEQKHRYTNMHYRVLDTKQRICDQK
jgi:hypothetical protein